MLCPLHTSNAGIAFTVDPGLRRDDTASRLNAEHYRMPLILRQLLVGVIGLVPDHAGYGLAGFHLFGDGVIGIGG